MPYTKKRYRKRHPKKVRRKKTYPMIRPLFPKTSLGKLRYCEEIELNAGSGLIAVHNFAANDMNDPNVTGTGHQPKLFDQYMSAYNHFCVLGSQIKVQYLPKVSNNSVPGVLGVHVSDRSSSLSGFTLEDIMESSAINSRDIRDLSSKLGATPIVRRFSTKKTYGKNAVSKSELTGGAASSPSELSYYTLFHATVGGNDPDPITLLVTIEYIALFTEREVVDGS